jgi:hypothetical protein
MGIGNSMQLDRSASFLAGMTDEQRAVWDSYDDNKKNALIQKYGQEDPMKSSVTTFGTHVKEFGTYVNKMTGDVDTDSGQPNTETPDVDTNNVDVDTGERLKEAVNYSADTEINTANKKKAIEIDTANTEKVIEIDSATEERAKEVGLDSYIAGSGVSKTDGTTIVNLGKQKPVQDKTRQASKSSNLGGAMAAAGGMALTMGYGMLSSNVTDSNNGAESTVEMLSTMAPMIGSMFGLPGMIAGAIVGGLGLLFNGIHKTDEELLKEAQEVSEGLDEMKNELKQSIEDLDSLESNEHKFAELIKGVN